MSMPSTPHRRSSREVDAVVRSAVRALLVARGYQAMTLEQVAAHAGVAKTVLYRRWPSKAEMVFEVAVHDRSIGPPADEGTLAGDLRALVTRVIALLSDPIVRSAMGGLLADLHGDVELMARFRNALIDRERSVVATILRRGRDRGEIPTDGGAAELHAQLLGTVFAWVYLVGGEPPADFEDRITTALLATVATIADRGESP